MQTLFNVDIKVLYNYLPKYPGNYYFCKNKYIEEMTRNQHIQTCHSCI